MPRRYMFTREQILDAALALTRQRGFSALTARALGERLGSSPKPIFSQFDSMEAVQTAVRQAAEQEYSRYVQETIRSGRYPPYKASGMAYIQFALEERELFKLLFLRDRSREPNWDDRDSVRPILAILQEKLNITEDEAAWFHTEMWLLVHGIATAITTSYLVWKEDEVSKILTDVYSSLADRFRRKS